MTVAGLPLHPLLVHLVVVGLPVTGLAAIVVSLWPAAQRRLGILLPLAAVAMAVVVPVTVRAGRSLAAELGGAPPRHAQLGSSLVWWALGLATVVTAQWLVDRRTTPAGTSPAGRGALHWVLAAVVVLVAAGAVVVTVMTGDSGARSVWGS